MSVSRSKRALQILGAGASAVLALSLAACGAANAPAADDKAEVKLGDTFTVAATEVPHVDILQFVKDNLAEEAGISFEIKPFSDYPLGNRWLAEGLSLIHI